MRSKLREENKEIVGDTLRGGVAKSQAFTSTGFKYTCINNFEAQIRSQLEKRNFIFNDKRVKFTPRLIRELSDYMSQPTNQLLTIPKIRSEFYTTHNRLFKKEENPSASRYLRIITNKKKLNYSFRRLPSYSWNV